MALYYGKSVRKSQRQTCGLGRAVGQEDHDDQGDQREPEEAILVDNEGHQVYRVAVQPEFGGDRLSGGGFPLR